MQTKRFVRKKQNANTQAFYTVLKEAWPSLSDKIGDVVYELVPFAINVLVIDPAFEGVDSFDRFDRITAVTKQLPRDIEQRASLILGRTPDEVARHKAEGGDFKLEEFLRPTW